MYIDVEAFHGNVFDSAWIDECESLICKFTMPLTKHRNLKSLYDSVKVHTSKRKPKPYYRKGERW